MDDKKFKIDFFEFSFLVEACIPDQPIARSMFWDEVINEYYHEMTDNEKENLYMWINRNSHFESQINKGNEMCLVFNARFNPDNQYLVFYTFKGAKGWSKCFKFNDKYYTEYYSSRQQFISDIFINKVEKINK